MSQANVTQGVSFTAESNLFLEYFTRLAQFAILTNLIVFSQPVCVFGITSNILNILVFVRQGFQDGVNITLAALAVSDIGALMAFQAYIINYNPLIELKNLVYRKTLFGFLALCVHQYFIKTSAMIIALASLERCMSVTLPLSVKLIFTRKVIVIANRGLLKLVVINNNVIRRIYLGPPTPTAWRGFLIQISYTRRLHLHSSFFPASSQLLPSLFPASYQLIPSFIPAYSQLIPSVIPAYSQLHSIFFPAYSQLHPSLFPASSQLLPSFIPASSQLIPSFIPASSQLIPNFIPAYSQLHLSFFPASYQLLSSFIPAYSQLHSSSFFSSLFPDHKMGCYLHQLFRFISCTIRDMATSMTQSQTDTSLQSIDQKSSYDGSQNAADDKDVEIVYKVGYPAAKEWHRDLDLEFRVLVVQLTATKFTSPKALQVSKAGPDTHL
ncbi:neuropeptides capa receptor [Biomphalaria pfeifferi]|uniref:Neuropeptides capa receptor n=1 Tax=Biomphalaria pfeifferi TaxID=112525 RepID=A0AAD8AZM3_BIOPF|nr:neuropeptides capa receptor [Biomphalaria pfeifferi]